MTATLRERRTNERITRTPAGTPVCASGGRTAAAAEPHREERDDRPRVADGVHRERDAGPGERRRRARRARARRCAPSSPELELSATAFGRSSCPDDPEDERVPRRRCRARATTPWTNPSTYSCQTRDDAGQREHRQRRPRSASSSDSATISSAAEVDAVDDRAADEREHRHRQGLDERERADRDAASRSARGRASTQRSAASTSR